jgi:DNA-binding CsgD family transcriptional regulator
LKFREILSLRQRECLGLAACGMSFQEIAIGLGISKSTVRLHLDTARIKLDALSVTHAVTLYTAMRFGKEPLDINFQIE